MRDLGSWFWVIFIIGVLLGGWSAFGGPTENRRAAWPSLFILVLIGILGWKVFQGPVTG